MTTSRTPREANDSSLGRRLRSARQARGLSLRNLADRIGVSASMLSQLENGKSQASLSTLLGLVNELDLSFDQLLDIDGVDGAHPHAGPSILLPGERPVLEMGGGVTWERLTTGIGSRVDMQLVEYPPGSTSSTDGRLARHDGTEFGYLMAGALTVTIGYETYELPEGCSIVLDSTTPHLYVNNGTRTARGVWFQLASRATPAES